MMKKLLLLLLIAIPFNLFSQNYLNESFEGSTFPPADWALFHMTPNNHGWERTYGGHNGNYSITMSNWTGSFIATPILYVQPGHDTLSFWVEHSVSNTVGFIRICQSYTGNTVDHFDTAAYLYEKMIDNNTDWYKISVPLTQFMNEYIYLAIYYESWRTSLYLDDVTGPEVPTILPCNRPVLSNHSNTDTSTYLYWTTILNSNNYIAQYMPMNSNSWDNAQVDTITTNNCTAHDLTYNTQYKARVCALCSNGTTSNWSNVINFQTLDTILTAKTLPQTNVTTNSAQLNGEILDNGDTIITKGFQWKRYDENNWNTINIVSENYNHSIVGLTNDTKYSYRSFVVSPSYTVYGNIVSFYTNFNAEDANVFYESFENDVFPPEGWSIRTDNPWIRTSNLSHTGAYSLYTSENTNSKFITKLIKIEPQFDTLKFWRYLYCSNMGSNMYIYASTSSDTNTLFDTINYLRSISLIQSPSMASTWQQNSIPLTKYMNQKIYVGFKYLSGYCNMYIDDFSGVLEGGQELSIKDNPISGPSINLYPNPARKETTLLINDINGKIKIRITDIQGKTIKVYDEMSNNNFQKTIDLNNYRKGIYLINISNDKINKTQKLIVE